MFRIHFPYFDPSKDVLPLAAACGIGRRGPSAGVTAKRFENLNAEARKYFEATPVEEAQLVFYPHCFYQGGDAARAAQLARQYDLPCIFVKHGDDPNGAGADYGTVFHESLFASRRRQNERVIPPFVDDPLHATEQNLQIREKRDRPLVGFCGFTGSAFAFPVYSVLRPEKLTGLLLRRRAIRALKKSKACETAFILRSQYWGGALGLTERRIKALFAKVSGASGPIDLSRNLETEARVHREFVRNILDTDYTLCIRGAGNYSYRFYEVLAAGRIPVFVNTDCELPFSDRIDWKRHCVWVGQNSLDRIGDAVAAFHSALTPAAFRDLQRENRRLYETYFTPLNYYRTLLAGFVREPIGSQPIGREPIGQR
ncbi:MAG: exostosin family protein [Bryobacteraceae bacterium]